MNYYYNHYYSILQAKSLTARSSSKENFGGICGKTSQTSQILLAEFTKFVHLFVCHSASKENFGAFNSSSKENFGAFNSSSK